jgi:hypothetical protein
MDELSLLGTGLEKLKTQKKTIINAIKVKCETTTSKNESKGSSSPLTYFTEQLAGVFEKPP